MTEEEKAAYYPHIVDTVTFDGTQWGVPIAFSTKALYWNKDLFKQAGLDPDTPPKTWEEEIAFAKQITEKTGIPGFGLVAKTFDNTMHQFLHWVYTNNGQIIDADGNIVMNSPEVLAALEGYKAMVPFAEVGPTAYEQNEVRAIFLDGKVAMIQAGPAPPTCSRTPNRLGHRAAAARPVGQGEGTLLITDSLAIFKDSGVEEKATEFAKSSPRRTIQEDYELRRRGRAHAAPAIAEHRQAGGRAAVLEAADRRHLLRRPGAAAHRLQGLPERHDHHGAVRGDGRRGTPGGARQGLRGDRGVQVGASPDPRGRRPRGSL